MFSSCIWNSISVLHADICICKNIHEDTCTYISIHIQVSLRVFLTFRILSDIHLSDCWGTLHVLFIISLDWDLFLMIFLVPPWSTRRKILQSYVSQASLSFRGGGALDTSLSTCPLHGCQGDSFSSHSECVLSILRAFVSLGTKLFPRCMNLCL